MFFVHRVTDTLAIPPTALSMDTKVAVEQAIDDLYPGKIWLDLGLVVSRYHSLQDFKDWEEEDAATEQGNEKARKKQRTTTKSTDKDGELNNDSDAIVVGPGACVAVT